MGKIWMSILFLLIWVILSVQSASAAHPHDNANNQKDSIEWVAFWSFPQTREEQLERMLTTELQKRILWALLILTVTGCGSNLQSASGELETLTHDFKQNGLALKAKKKWF